MFLQQGKGVGVRQGRGGWWRGKILGGQAFQVILDLLREDSPPVAVGGLGGFPRCRLVVSLVAPGGTQTEKA